MKRYQGRLQYTQLRGDVTIVIKLYLRRLREFNINVSRHFNFKRKTQVLVENRNVDVYVYLMSWGPLYTTYSQQVGIMYYIFCKNNLLAT